MSDTITKSKNVSMSRKCGDGITASPRPFRVSDGFLDRYSTGHCDIVDAKGELVAVRVSSADAALICDAVNLKTRIDEAMADESGYLHPTVLDGKPMVFVSPPPSEAEEIKMHRDYETNLLLDRERFRRGYYEALAHNDRLHDIVKRLAHVAQDALDFAEVMSGIVPDNSERAKARNEIEGLLHEAREAIEEDRK